MKKIDKLSRTEKIEFAILDYISDMGAFDYWLEDMDFLKMFLFKTYGFKHWEVKRVFNKIIKVKYKKFLQDFEY